MSSYEMALASQILARILLRNQHALPEEESGELWAAVETLMRLSDWAKALEEENSCVGA